MNKKPMFNNLPSRKELNEERFKEIVTELSEFKATEGGELAIMGEYFYMLFSDLSATKQEGYNRILANELKKYRERVRNEPSEHKKTVCNNCGWLEIPGRQDPIEENGKAYCPVCDNVIRKAESK